MTHNTPRNQSAAHTPSPCAPGFVSFEDAKAYALETSKTIHGTYSVYGNGSGFVAINGVDQAAALGPQLFIAFNGNPQKIKADVYSVSPGFIPKTVVFSYPLRDDVEVPVEEALDWADSQPELWSARMVISTEGQRTYGKSWWYPNTSMMQRIGAGAYGDALVTKRVRS